MFVMINASDNPWMIALLLFVQVIVPILQSSAGSDEDDSQATNVLVLFLLGLALLSLWKLTRFFRIVREMRGLYPHLGWLAFFKEAYAQAQAQATADAAARAAQENANGDATNSENFNKVMRIIQVMPTEEFKTPTELQDATIGELKERLKRRDVAYAGCVERKELVDLLVEFRGGPSNNDTCCICCDEYQSGDVMRLLRKCKHEFHLECLDKWAFSSHSQSWRTNSSQQRQCTKCSVGILPERNKEVEHPCRPPHLSSASWMATGEPADLPYPMPCDERDPLYSTAAVPHRPSDRQDDEHEHQDAIPHARDADSDHTHRLCAPPKCMCTVEAGLYSFGEGYLGSLGSGSYENVAAPTQLPSTTHLAVKQLSAGWAHGGFITEDGDAYVFGRTQSFRDVIRSTNIQRIAPWLLTWMNNFTLRRGVDTLEPAHVELPEGEKAKKIVCSTALTYILTESGKMFTFGANSYGQCGNNVEGVSEVEPQHVPFDGDEVADIAAGYQHGLAVTKNGAVFSWGKGERGQLGFGTANIKAPQEIIALKGKNVVNVSAGFNHSSALTDEGELFLWGKLLNLKGKEESNGDQIIPRLVRTSDAVTLLECSHFHTSYITADEKIWIVGRTPSGRQEKQDQLVHVASMMHATPFQITNEQLVASQSIQKIGKGVDSSSFVTKDGRAFEWTYTGGLRLVEATKHLRVDALESGFKYRLLLGSASK